MAKNEKEQKVEILKQLRLVKRVLTKRTDGAGVCVFSGINRKVRKPDHLAQPSDHALARNSEVSVQQEQRRMGNQEPSGCGFRRRSLPVEFAAERFLTRQLGRFHREILSRL